MVCSVINHVWDVTRHLMVKSEDHSMHTACVLRSPSQYIAMIRSLMGLKLRFPKKSYIAALGAAFQIGAAA